MTNDKSESNVVKDQINNTSDACGAELPQKQMIKTNTQKQQTASFKKIMDYRDRINSERACLLAEDLSCVVYIYENRQGKPCAIAYRGRAKKAAFNYSYKSEEERFESVSQWMQARSEEQAEREVIKKQRSAVPRALAVDDVLMASWGYDQTNIDYYKVTKLVGKSSVEVVEIGAIGVADGDMSGKCIPDVDNEVGKPFTRRVKNGTGIKVDSCVWPSKLEYTVVDGKRVYRASYYSSYA